MLSPRTEMICVASPEALHSALEAKSVDTNALLVELTVCFEDPPPMLVVYKRNIFEMLNSHGGAAELGAAILSLMHGVRQFKVSEGAIVKTAGTQRTDVRLVPCQGLIPGRYVQHVVSAVHVVVAPCVDAEAALAFLRQALRAIGESGFETRRMLDIVRTSRCSVEWSPVDEPIPIKAYTYESYPGSLSTMNLGTHSINMYHETIVHDISSHLKLDKETITPFALGATADYIYPPFDTSILIDNGKVRVKAGGLGVTARWSDSFLHASLPKKDIPPCALLYPLGEQCAFCNESTDSGAFVLYSHELWGVFYVKCCDICAGTITSHKEWRRHECRIFDWRPLCPEQIDKRTRTALDLDSSTSLEVRQLDQHTFAGRDILVSSHAYPELISTDYRLGQRFVIPSVYKPPVLTIDNVDLLA